jgi:hypothetical protein
MYFVSKRLYELCLTHSLQCVLERFPNHHSLFNGRRSDYQESLGILEHLRGSTSFDCGALLGIFSNKTEKAI